MRSFARGSLEVITIHKVLLGHYLHHLRFKKLPSPILRQIGYSSTASEG